MLETIDEIISGFEEALELERELGVRVVPFEEPLVTANRIQSSKTQSSPSFSQPPPSSSQLSQSSSHSTQSYSQRAANNSVVVSHIERADNNSVIASHIERADNNSVIASHIPTSEERASRDWRGNLIGLDTQLTSPITSGIKAKSPSNPDFAFIAQRIPSGEAAALLKKMVAAMGYTLEQVSVVTAASALECKPNARVYIVLGGSDAFRTFAPTQRAALGMWTEVAGVPTIVTYSPERILSYFRGDAEGLTKAKRQIWSDLKSAMARIGKKVK